MRINSFLVNNIFYQNVKNNLKMNNNITKKANNITGSINISDEGRMRLKAHKDYSVNRRIDESIDLESYLEKADNENKDWVSNSGNKIKVQVKYKDELEAFGEALTDKYRKLADIAKSHENPEYYLSEKYMNKNSPYYESGLTDEERRIGFKNELDMIRYGKLTSVEFKDSLFRSVNVSDNMLTMSKGEFDRGIVNNQMKNMLENSAICLSDEAKIDLNIDPYSYNVDLTGNVDDIILKAIKKLLESENNSKELYAHIIISSLDNENNNKKITNEGKLKYNLYHQCMNFTGLDIRKLEERDGSYFDEQGNNIKDLYNKGIDESIKNNENKLPKNDSAYYKEWFSEMVNQSYEKKWNNMSDMYLGIRLTKDGFVDL